MTNFGSYLGEIIEADYEGHRSRFAKACGITAASITNYLSKGDLPTPETLGRIVNALSNKARTPELVVAYWQDIETLAGFSNVTVRMAIDWLGSIPEFQPDPLDEEIKTALTKIQRRAQRDPQFRAIIRSIAAWDFRAEPVAS